MGLILEVTAVPFTPAHRGGGESYPWRLSHALASFERVVNCYAYENGPPEEAGEFRRIAGWFLDAGPLLTVDNPLPSGKGLMSIATVLQTLESEIEFVHVHNLGTAMSTAWMFLSRLRRTGARFRILLTDHGSRWFPFPRATAAMADYYIPVSESSRDRLNRLAQRPSWVLPPGVPMDYPALAQPPLSMEARDIDLLFFGRIARWKRPDLVLQLAADLSRESGRPIHTIIAGSATDRPFLGWLRREAERLRIQDSTQFVLGPSEVDAARLFCRSKLHPFLSTTSDRFGRTYPAPELAAATVLEAGAAGTPSICNDLPGVREQIRPGGTGEVVSVDNWKETVRTCGELLGDAERWTTLSRGAREFVVKERTYGVLAKRFSNYLNEIRSVRS